MEPTEKKSQRKHIFSYMVFHMQRTNPAFFHSWPRILGGIAKKIIILFGIIQIRIKIHKYMDDFVLFFPSEQSIK